MSLAEVLRILLDRNFGQKREAGIVGRGVDDHRIARGLDALLVEQRGQRLERIDQGVERRVPVGGALHDHDLFRLQREFLAEGVGGLNRSGPAAGRAGSARWPAAVRGRPTGLRPGPASPPGRVWPARLARASPKAQALLRVPGWPAEPGWRGRRRLGEGNPGKRDGCERDQRDQGRAERADTVHSGILHPIKRRVPADARQKAQRFPNT